MDFFTRLDSVVNLDDYIELTHDLENKYKDVKITLNKSTIHSVREIKTLEIEFFAKCDDSGAALKIFRMMLSSPPSNTWNLLGPEVVDLVQYWLEAVRNHLIFRHMHWWTFLKHLFAFIKVIRKKDPSMPDLLVKETADLMLDLATSGKMDCSQRYETLYTFNLVCSEASRDVRMGLKDKFEPYFIRLSTIIATCGHFPSQFAAVETLLRWLLPRQDPAIRKEAANKWLQPHLYSRTTVDIFLTRNWMNFLQDARDFLNCHNDANNLVTSVICRKLAIGDIVILKTQGDDLRLSWVDINSGNRSVSVVLEPHHLEALGRCDVSATACETLTIIREHVKYVTFYRESNEVKVLLHTLAPPVVLPTGVKAYSASECEVYITISSRSSLPKVDAALRTVFDDKYRVKLDVQDAAPLSPVRAASIARRTVSVGERPRFSQQAKEKRRQAHAGYMLWSRRFSALKSPSSVSTASLAQLHDKLANLPYYEFTKEPVSVCAQPDLSVVTELNESQISRSLGSTSTLKLRPCEVKNFRAYIEERKSQSDNELIRKHNSDKQNLDTTRGSQSDHEYIKRTTNQDGISYLFAATVASNETILNTTFDRLPKNKELNTDDLIELLVQEALQSKERTLDSGISTGDGKKTQEHDSETIEDTQYVLKNSKPKTPVRFKKVEPTTPKPCTIVSKSTSDESNTEAVIETPVNYVTLRKRNQRRKSVTNEDTENAIEDQNDNNFNNEDVENFFNQHFSKNQLEDIVINPTLAKKNNETSSETSDDLIINVDDNFGIRNEEDMPDSEVVECLNDILDKVCDDFRKCTEYIEKEVVECEIMDNVEDISNTREQHFIKEPGVSTDKSEGKDSKKPVKNTRSKRKPKTQLKIVTKNKQSKLQPKKGKLILEPVSKLSIILETNTESDANKTSISDSKKISTDSEKKSPRIRRKRKLYSPKDDQIGFDRNDAEVVKTISSDTVEVSRQPVFDSSDDDDTALSELTKENRVTPKPVTSKSVTLCYKEIEKDRQKDKYSKPINDGIDLSKSKKDKPVTPKVTTPKQVTPKSVTSCYKEIEQERQKYRKTRACRSRGRKIETPPSPKTMKLNDAFEKLKDNIESNENIKFVDKNSDKDKVYNFTSDSEDEDFKQKKVDIQKRASTTTTTIESSTSVMSTYRSRKKVNYTDDRKSSNKANTKTVKRKKVPRRKTSKTKTVVPNIDNEAKEIIDERMREAPPELLNTSFSLEKVIEAVKEPEPIVRAPQLELIDDDANLDAEDSKIKDVPAPLEDVTKETVKPEKKSTRSDQKVIKNKENKLKEDTNNKINIEKEITGDDRNSSPLPGLIIETETAENLDESLSTNMVKRFEKIYKEGPEAYNETVNTTQNMLSDNEPLNHSSRINITEELGIDREENTEQNNSDVIDETINSDHSSKISKANSTKCKRSRLKLKTNKIVNPTVTSDTILNEVKAAKEPITNKTDKQPIKSAEVNESQKSKKSVKSSIQTIDLNEIICFKPEIVTRSKYLANSRSKSREIEVIDITNNSCGKVSEIKSERSIASEGITGHGDIDEMPPSTKLLEEKVSPREIQDMDQSIREYFIKLNKDVNNSEESIDKTEFPKRKLENKTVKKPVEDKKSEPSSESIAKGAHRDTRDYEIANMLPSPRNTETESSSKGSKIKSPTIALTRLSLNDMAKLPSIRNIDTESSTKDIMSPTVSVRRLSLEDMAKLPSIRDTDSESSSKGIMSPTVSVPRLSSKDVARWLPSTKATPQSSFEISKEKSVPTTSKTVLNPRLPMSFNLSTPTACKVSLVRKSLISPIKFDDFLPNAKIPYNNYYQYQEDTANIQSLETTTEDVPKIASVSRNQKHDFRPTHESSPISRAEKSEQSTPRVSVKRKSPIAETVENKKRKIDEQSKIETVDISSSKQSSTVDDWLKKISTQSRGEDNVQTSYEAVKTLMEKLDTTLAEINYNTTKKFIGLFVDAQKQLTERIEARRDSYREVFSDIFTGVTQLLDHKFSEMVQQSETQDKQFMSWLKQQASEVLKRDCRQKQVMVRLLKEDVQAVLRHLEAQGDVDEEN